MPFKPWVRAARRGHPAGRSVSHLVAVAVDELSGKDSGGWDWPGGRVAP